MTLLYSQPINVARLEAVESTIGGTAHLHIYTGAPPAISAAATGTELVDMVLPADWMNVASGAAPATNKTKLGTWSGTGTAGAGAGLTAGYFRVTNSANSATGIQGNITTTVVGTGDMLMDNTSIAQNQVVTVNTFTLTAGNQ